MILAFVSSQSQFNHHVRYVLPALPFAVVGVGKLGYFLNRSRWRAGVVVAALVA